MAAAKTAATETQITLTRLEKDVLEVEIQGLTPYIPHRWSEKAKRLMPGHPEAKALKDKKGVRMAEEEASACVYRLSDGRPGIPATSIKAAMVSACRHFDGLTMTSAKLLFFVEGEGPEQLIPFTFGEQILREDTPRNANGGADLRYRYAFSGWKAKVRVSFVKNAITPESVIALIDAAGLGGVGDWRPSSPKSATGTFGSFRVVTE